MSIIKNARTEAQHPIPAGSQFMVSPRAAVGQRQYTKVNLIDYSHSPGSVARVE
jgi:hypothetical protein